MFFNFNHYIVNVYKIVFDWPIPEGGLRHDFLQSVIELDELCESRLQYLSAGLEVGETPHDVCIDAVDGFLPVSIEPSDQLTYLLYRKDMAS